MTLGPVSYTVVAFPGNRFSGGIAPEVEKLVSNGTVRVLDLVFVGKDEGGDTVSLEFDQRDELAAFGDLDGEVGGLINEEDLDHVADQLPPGNSALVIVLGGPVGDATGRGCTSVGRRGDRHGADPGRPGRVGVGRAGRGAEELSLTSTSNTRSRRANERSRRCLYVDVQCCGQWEGRRSLRARRPPWRAGSTGASNRSTPSRTAQAQQGRRIGTGSGRGGGAELGRPDHQAQGAGRPEGSGHPDRRRVQHAESEDPRRDVLTPEDATRCRSRPTDP